MKKAGCEHATLPSGLTQAQVDARPDTFVGMVVYLPDRDEWWVETHNWEISQNYADECLLPGEPGCPWPPPPELQHEWQEGDQAWVLTGGIWY
jgi:hypothetical protein